MIQNPEWNMAIEGDEDWKAATSSEIFRSFIQMAINKEGIFAKEDEEKEDESEGVPQPLMRNNDYNSASENDFLDELIAEAQANTEEVDDINEDIIDTNDDGLVDDIDDNFDVEAVDPPSSLPSDYSSSSSSNEYETGAGDSEFIDIGLTDETMKDIESDGVMSGSSTDAPAIREVMDVYHEEEIADAEQELGLDSNAAYIFGKGIEG